jgi:hypothetical protein
MHTTFLIQSSQNPQEQLLTVVRNQFLSLHLETIFSLPRK